MAVLLKKICAPLPLDENISSRYRNTYFQNNGLLFFCCGLFVISKRTSDHVPGSPRGSLWVCWNHTLLPLWQKNEYNINVKQPADSVALGDVFIPLPLSFLLRRMLEQHRQGLRDVEGQRWNSMCSQFLHPDLANLMKKIKVVLWLF